MRIAYILPSLASQGPIIVAQTLVRNLIKYHKEDIEYIHVYYFDDIIQLSFNCDTFQIKESDIIDYNNYDIIHSHGFRPDRYIYKFSHLLKGVSTITTIHQDIFQDLKYQYNIAIATIFTPIWLKYIRKIQHAVPISHKIYSIYSNKINNLTPHIYNGVDLQTDIKPDQQIVAKLQNLKKDNHTILMSYANIVKRKGLEQLIELTHIRKDIILILIGDGKDRNRLESLSHKYQLNDRVIFFSFTKNPYFYLKYADIYAIPSRSEGFGLALVEGILSHKPVIASSIDVFRELFNEYEVSFFNLDDISSLNKAFEHTIQLKDSLINNSYQKANSLYTGKIMAQNYISFYKSIISKS